MIFGGQNFVGLNEEMFRLMEMEDCPCEGGIFEDLPRPMWVILCSAMMNSENWWAGHDGDAHHGLGQSGYGNGVRIGHHGWGRGMVFPANPIFIYQTYLCSTHLQGPHL